MEALLEQLQKLQAVYVAETNALEDAVIAEVVKLVAEIGRVTEWELADSWSEHLEFTTTLQEDAEVFGKNLAGLLGLTDKTSHVYFYLETVEEAEDDYNERASVSIDKYETELRIRMIIPIKRIYAYCDKLNVRIAVLESVQHLLDTAVASLEVAETEVKFLQETLNSFVS